MGLLDFTDECKAAAQGVLPKDEKGKTPVRMDVYKNKFIEKYLAQAHWSTPGLWLFLVAYGIYFIATNASYPWWQGAIAFVGGTLLFTLVEYFLHRYPFHYEATSDFGKMNVFLMHGYHHDFPQDPTRLVLPLIAILPLAAIVGVPMYLALGEYFLPAYAGLALGYVGYDWVHYATHHFNPKGKTLLGKVFRWWARYHMLHHFDSPQHRMGISTPLWDFVFGTYLPNNVMWRKLEAEKKKAEEAAQATA